ncbi:MAG: hypothetical protein ACJ8AT_13580 [Hyalangium sp.]|uniref:hypothetical protein n=1 Tax=Hyalangium sp. TaxID=2028555 RepID=UPI00389A862C
METLQEAERELTLEEIRDRIRDYVKQASDAQVYISAFYSYFKWQSLNAGPEYKNAPDYLCRHIPSLTREDLSWYENSSKGFGLGVLLYYGLKNLRALRNYAKAAKITVPSPDPSFTVVQVPQPDGTTVDKPFWSCRLDEMQRAARVKRKPAPKTRAPVSDMVRWLYLGDSLNRHFKDVAPVRIDMRQESGMALVTVRDVPMAEMERLIKALRAGMDAQPFALKDENRSAA